MNRPKITVHFAQSLDGRIATRTGRSQWLSGSESLRLAHQLRASHDAVLVGVGTVIADDPLLTVRHIEGPSPARIVVDSSLRIPVESRVLSGDGPQTTIVTTSRTSPERIAAVAATGAELMVVPADDTGRADLTILVRELVSRELRSLLVEGGAAIITSFLRLRLARRIVISMCPKIVGAGIEAIQDLGVSDLSEALTFSHFTFTQVGQDNVFDGEIDWGHGQE